MRNLQLWEAGGGPAAQATSPMRSVLQRWGEESPFHQGYSCQVLPGTGSASRGIMLGGHQPKPGAWVHLQGFKDRGVGRCQT